MKKNGLFLGFYLSVISMVFAQDQSSFSLYSYLKNGPVKESFDFLKDTDNYEIIREKINQNITQDSKVKTLKIRLKNGIEVMLFSDPDVIQSAAAISVHVGSWDDPKEFPGMAHFVEHLLFMGNKKYPIESDFSRFIGERGGHYNAFTTHDRTVYGFSVNHEGFEGALDRLSSFFKSPSFSQDTISREMNAVHHEFEDQIENEGVRLWRVIKETGNQDHPNAVFSCGNLQSLGSIAAADVKNWFDCFYKPSSMQLAILSPYSIPDMCSLVVDGFSDMAEKEFSNRNFKGRITTEHQQGHFIHLKSTYQSRSLQMIWEVPVEFLGKAPDTAMDLAHMAIDHPGDSSLLSLMKKDDLANDVVVDYWKIEKEHVLFLIELGLTKKGVRQLDDVVARVFSVLSKLKNERMPEYLFDELYLRKKITSSYTTPCDSYNFVIDAVSDIMDFGIESYPNSFLLSSKYDPESYQHFFDSLKAEKCLFFLVAPQKESGVKPTAVEKWMGTEYLVRPINESKLKYWSSIEPDAEVEFCPALPPENQQHDIFDIDEDIQNSISVYKTEAASIHLSTNKDNPETGIGAWFCFSSPQALANVKNSSLASIFVYYIEEKLKEYIPKHLQELLSWSVYPSDKGICVILDVFGENIEMSLLEFFSCFTNIPIEEELFEKVKQDFIDSYNGDPEPIELAQITAESIIMSNPVIFSDIYAHFPALELEDFKEFVSTVFNSNIRVQGLFYGNLSRQETLNYWKIVESCFQDSTFLIDYNDPLIDQFQELSWDSPKVVEKTTHRKGNALVLVLNVGALQRENWAAQKIVSQLVQEEFFEELRTRQQTAYKLYSWGDAFHDKLLQFFAIQSSSHNPRDLLERTEAFLNDFAKNFQTKVSKERVALVRYMLITALKKHKKSFLTNEELRYLNASIEKLKSISYEEVQKFVSKAFSSSNTKKIAVLVEGATKTGS